MESGGRTIEGATKLHVWWKLTEPAEGEDLAKLCQVRGDIAVKIGGDTHFRSAHQPIRVAGAGGGPHVCAFNGLNLTSLASFFAFTPDFGGGINVSARDINGDGRADIVATPASSLLAYLRIVDAESEDDLDAFLSYTAAFRGGVSV